MLTIDLETARRFILGKQGVWPGRRWQGAGGTADAMRAIEYLQLDPLQIIARSQDITLYSRVLDYRPGMWEEVTYEQRQFFDWGGWLATRPMEELPYWRVVMRREREGQPETDGRVRKMGEEHAEAVTDVLDILRERGQVSNRDFSAAARKRTDSYRGRKDSSLALYYLWRIGEVMTHHRENFERVYALTEAVAPAHLIRESSEEEASRFVIRKEVAFSGLLRVKRTGDAWQRGALFGGAPDVRRAMLAEGELVEVRVNGWKQPQLALSSDLPLMEALAAGRTPPAWAPLDTDTSAEAVFLAPLDPVSARGRAKALFGFDYVWEVYKPAHKRLYGYYTLPVLWGDQLVARFDSKLDRPSNTFIILGFWLEDTALAASSDFAEALARGFARFTAFLGAAQVDASAIEEPLLRKAVVASAPPASSA